MGKKGKHLNCRWAGAAWPSGIRQLNAGKGGCREPHASRAGHLFFTCQAAEIPALIPSALL